MRLHIVVIVVVSVLALAATVGTVVVGSNSFEGLVVDKPYEAGLAWDKTRRDRERLGWSVSLKDARFRTGKSDLIVIISDRNGKPLSDASVTITLTRPSTRAYDRSYEASPQSKGRYRAAVDLPLFGNWDAVIDICSKGDCARFSETIAAERGGA